MVKFLSFGPHRSLPYIVSVFNWTAGYFSVAKFSAKLP